MAMTTSSISSVVTIPCDFCNSSVVLDQYDSHWTFCANRNRIEIEKAFQRSLNEFHAQTFQCEFCFRKIDLDYREYHLRQCLVDQVQQFERLKKPMTNDLIPCEYCRQSFPFECIEKHQIDCQREHGVTFSSPTTIFDPTSNFPSYWDFSSAFVNLTRHVLPKESNDFQSIESLFHQTLPSQKILQIERIQNRRWFRQYDAHKEGFIERYGQSTEQWLFHGCSANAAESIIRDCFNRSHTARCLFGQGIYFAADAKTSFNYSPADEKNVQRMFLARVLVGRTTNGDASTRVCPSGFDTTGTNSIKVIFHDAQAYGEYLIMFQ